MVSVLKKPVVDRDRIVIFAENGTADIATVYDIDDQAIYAASPVQEYAIPVGDVRAYVGGSGRIYTLAAEPDYVRDTERLAQLEKSIVLRQITHYEKPIEQKGSLSFKDIMMYVIIFILLLAVVFK